MSWSGAAASNFAACLAADVPVPADVAERLLAKQVRVPVAVEIDEAIPLADFQVLIAVGAPLVLRRRRFAGVLEEPHEVGVFLDEQIEIAVGVDIDELRARNIETAEKWQRVRLAVGVEHREGRDRALEGGRRLPQLVPSAVEGRQRRRQPDGGGSQGPERGDHFRARAPMPVRFLPSSIDCSTCRLATLTIASAATPSPVACPACAGSPM